MASSNDAVREIAEILRRHVDHTTLEKIINGNKSFRDTIERLADELRRE
jgi:Trm5-related predicted tRNA methylase